MYPQPQRQKPVGTSVRRGAPVETKTCLVTGFDAFGRNKFNPSGMLVGMLPESVPLKKGALELSGMVLPTCCTDGWNQLSAQLTSSRPDVLLLTGLAQKRDRLSLERFALNVRDYRIEDNAGHLWQGEPIDPRGPDAFRSQVPLNELKRNLLKAGYPCEISNNAGTFVCNDMYYRALMFQRQKNPNMVVLFLHVPLPGWFGKALKELDAPATRLMSSGRDAQLEAILAATLKVAKFCANLV